PIQNSVTYELDSIDAALKEVSKIFLYIGIGFALFAALMLSNFIGTSISYKKQEIGILRAIGSRSNDVFRIFFAESFIIAMINFTLSALGTFTVTAVINYVIRNQIGILITILNFDLRQIVLLLGVSILVAFIASYIPVKRIASKRPIDAIRGR
ncbi:MAG: FtsX-like permease family protein, partial [Acutalibacteraceae bacterium]|nr:FtsX-like permease family protein [Acutalibacteraceae bacterium]